MKHIRVPALSMVFTVLCLLSVLLVGAPSWAASPIQDKYQAVGGPAGNLGAAIGGESAGLPEEVATRTTNAAKSTGRPRPEPVPRGVRSAHFGSSRGGNKAASDTRSRMKCAGLSGRAGIRVFRAVKFIGPLPAVRSRRSGGQSETDGQAEASNPVRWVIRRPPNDAVSGQVAAIRPSREAMSIGRRALAPMPPEVPLITPGEPSDGRTGVWATP